MNLSIGLCALLLSSGVVLAKGNDVIKDTFPDDQAKITKILQDIVELAAKKDVDRIDAMHSYGPKFTKFSYSADTGKEKMAGKDRSTLVFAKDGSTWKIVHEHHSPLKTTP